MAFFVKLNSRFRKILDLSIFPNPPGAVDVSAAIAARLQRSNCSKRWAGLKQKSYFGQL
jgi:hypothetical protein